MRETYHVILDRYDIYKLSRHIPVLEKYLYITVKNKIMLYFGKFGVIERITDVAISLNVHFQSVWKQLYILEKDGMIERKNNLWFPVNQFILICKIYVDFINNSLEIIYEFNETIRPIFKVKKSKTKYPNKNK